MDAHRNVLFLFFFFMQGFLASPPVEVTPDKIILLESRPLEVKCRVSEPITYCRFAVPGVSKALNLRPNFPAHEGIQYSGAGLEKGECGMLIRSVSAKHSGIIQCSMGLINDVAESTGNMTLIVAQPPEPPRLRVSSGTTYREAFVEGETIQANCKIKNARPVANISWFLGSEPIYDKLSRTITEEENGLATISQNLTRTVTYVDHGKDLKCVAGHIALGPGSINHSIYKLDIRFPPKPKSQELEKFGFIIGQPGKIVVTFYANPIPDIMWKVDQENLKQGTRDRMDRYEAGILQNKGPGVWDAVLNIKTVRAEEVEKRYTLIAQNNLGHESYKVAISTSPEPPANITAGAIVGIVIAVLVLLLFVFIVIFARATGKWCFSGGTPRPVGESRLPFGWPSPNGGNNKKKILANVNSLIYEEYTLVETEDGNRSYVSPEERTRLSLTEKLKAVAMASKARKLTAESKREKESDSSSDCGYEIPISAEIDQRKSSNSFQDEDSYQEENGRINLPFYMKPFEANASGHLSRTCDPMLKGKKENKDKREREKLRKKERNDNNNVEREDTWLNFGISDDQTAKSFGESSKNKVFRLFGKTKGAKTDEESPKSTEGFPLPWKNNNKIKTEEKKEEDEERDTERNKDQKESESFVEEEMAVELREGKSAKKFRKGFSLPWAAEIRKRKLIDDVDETEKRTSMDSEAKKIGKSISLSLPRWSLWRKQTLDNKFSDEGKTEMDGAGSESESESEKKSEELETDTKLKDAHEFSDNDDAKNDGLLGDDIKKLVNENDGSPSCDALGKKSNLLDLIDCKTAEDLVEPEEFFPEEPVTGKFLFKYKMEFNKKEKTLNENQKPGLGEENAGSGVGNIYPLYRHANIDLSNLKKKTRNQAIRDPNPLKKMFGIRRVKEKHVSEVKETTKGQNSREADDSVPETNDEDTEIVASDSFARKYEFGSPEDSTNDVEKENGGTWSWIYTPQVQNETNPFRMTGRYGLEAEAEPETGGSEPDGGFCRSDTESADHGSADKSSMSKLTQDKQPKKLMNGLFGSFRKGKTKSGRVDAQFGKDPYSFEVSIKDQEPQAGEQEDVLEVSKTEGIVYAELDMTRSPGTVNVMRRDDDKTEYAEIIYPTIKSGTERAMEELRKSRENLVASRENLAETEEAFATTLTPEGKKEAAV